MTGAATITEFSVSPDGRWVAFVEQFNVWVAPFAATGKTISVGPGMKTMPVKQVSKRSGEFVHWSADSSSLHWAHGATLYTRDLKDAFAFLEGAPEELPEPVEEGLDLGFSVAADVPAGRIALTGARVITMRDAESTEEVIENGVVVVDGNRIEAVGPAHEVTIPGDAFVLDVTGKTIIPGLVDVHAHGAMARSEITPEQNWQQFSNLAFGVTTIHDPSNDTSSIFAAAELQRAGLTVAPRIYSTGTILYGAHAPGYKASIDGYEDALFHVQRLKDVGAISVKSYQQPRRDQRQQVIAAGRELGMMVVPEGGAKFQHNMNEITDGHTGIEHAIPVVRAYDDVQAAVVAERGGLHADLRRRLRRPVGRDLLVRPHGSVAERAADALRRRASSSSRVRSGGRPRPTNTTTTSRSPEFAKELRDLGVPVLIGAHGQLRGTRRALGDLDDGAGRLHPLGGAAGGDDRRSALRRSRRRHRLDRGGQARRPRRDRRQPVEGAAPLGVRRLHDDQRPAVRRDHDEPDRAGSCPA